MKVEKIIFAVLFALLLTPAFAQVNPGKVEDVIKNANDAKNAGRSDAEIIKMLQQSGVSKDQAEKMKSLYDDDIEKRKKLLGGYGKDSEAVNRSRSTNGVGSESDSIITPAKSNSNAIFGRDLFNNTKLTFEPNLNIPTPQNYKLGPGDEIIIDVWGNSQTTIDETISPDGSIIIPNQGHIYLNGLKIEDATKYLRTILSRNYEDLSSDDPQTFMKVTLGSIRTIKVNVLGEVTAPGTYSLPSLASIFHALYSAGGVNDVGTLREVVLFRNGKKISTVDVYDYIMNGDVSTEVTLQDGDIINVGTYEKLVQIYGEVKRPMIFELKSNENLEKLIKYAGGFTRTAYLKSVNVDSRGDSGRKIYTLNKNEFSSFVPQDGDIVDVSSMLDRYENRVQIAGAVYRPGNYALNSDIKTLGQLLKVAEGVKGDAFLGRAFLYREKPNYEYEILSIDLMKLMDGSYDIDLKNNDLFFVASTGETGTIEVHGEVRTPGNFPFADNMTLADALLLSGGFSKSAAVVNVEVARRLSNPETKEEQLTDALTFNFEFKNGLAVNGNEAFLLQPYDQIYVRRSPGYKEQRNVSITGEVLFEGTYVKTNGTERLSDIVKRAGGVTSKAYVKGARLVRRLNDEERQKVQDKMKLMARNLRDSISTEDLNIGNTYYVGIDLEKALKHPGSDADLVLREGDELQVPLYSNTVKINGGVMYPNAVTYEKNISFKEYIDNAGGYAIRAKKHKAYVLYMNGKVGVKKSARRHLEPGCEIIVPMKPDREPASLDAIMRSTYSLTSVAALVTALLR